jgi:hypothetical protein
MSDDETGIVGQVMAGMTRPVISITKPIGLHTAGALRGVHCWVAWRG